MDGTQNHSLTRFDRAEIPSLVLKDPRPLHISAVVQPLSPPEAGKQGCRMLITQKMLI